MPRLSPRQRISTAARWPLGVVLTAWRYLWRTVPLHRTEEAGDPRQDAPPPLPDRVSHDDVQYVHEGHGPLFHRRYRGRVRESGVSAAELIERLCTDLDAVAPSEFASFQKTHGPAGEMHVGDEYVVRMPGPWDGPVRVVDRSPTSFSFVTLHGHLEAGRITFSASEEDGMLVFEIESWARSATRLVDLLYDHLKVSKEVQLHMWTSMVQQVAEVCGGRLTGGIVIHTRRVEGGDLTHA